MFNCLNPQYITVIDKQSIEGDEDEDEDIDPEEDDYDSNSEDEEQNEEEFFGLLDEHTVSPEDDDYDFYLRVNCVIHTLQLVLTKSIEKKCAALWKIIRRLRKIISTIRKSHKAKEKFFEKTGSTLPLPGKTRWNSHFKMIEMFLKYASEVKTIFSTEFPKKKYNISCSDLETLKEFVGITQIFQSAILRLQTGGITSSKCYGIFRELLDETSKSYNDPVLDALSKSMNEDLTTRFGKFVDVFHEDFDPHYVLCFLMDPHESICLLHIEPRK